MRCRRHHHCGRHPKMMAPVTHPTMHQTQYKHYEYIVPEIHPVHTTTVNKHLYKHYHSFPHTESQVNEVYHQHFGPAQRPRRRPCPRRPFC
ncbi:CotD family spore coat protein [Aliibacillus thermotolerans]|uniref:CotD family spore coat protein n=1 Tax=Aliibacillus thermotolerans TaxID=1834418 RepID=A0ABW0U6E0_9BACI|nr:CotD family spore coat protein [Aliibacillus thermotolerans]MDA3130073.1 spore coat protein CotH [Aliibacillus thermotolerans]